MIEVTHGPHLVDNNIFTSDFTLVNAAQGGAYVNNLCCGFVDHYPVWERATPYHIPHSTDVLGTAFVYGFDDRWYQNIFLGGTEEGQRYGTNTYDGAPVSMEEYIERVRTQGSGDVGMFAKVKQPVYIDGNVYYKGAPHFDREENYLCLANDPQIRILDEVDTVYLEIYVEEEVLSIGNEIITSDKLEVPRIVEERFENPDGSDIVLDKDMLGCCRGASPVPGPLQNLVVGYNKIKIWERSCHADAWNGFRVIIK